MGMRTLCLLAVLTCAAFSADRVIQIPAGGEGADYWPRWRGPSGQGLVAGDGYVDVWSDTENVIWKVEVPGNGNSSPIVWDDRIFFTTAYDSGARRSLLCFRRSDGKLLWETFAPNATPEHAQRKNGHASGSPATDGHYVYAYLGNHGIIAVDFEGKLIWQRDLGSTNNYHGTSCSPLLYKDRVILFQDQQKPAKSYVAALDKVTGKVLWRTERSEDTGWGSPIALRTPERDEIIVSSMYKVYAYNPDTGEELWSSEGNSWEVIPTPVVGNNLLYASSGRAGPTLAIRPGGSGNVTKSHVVWKSPRGSPFVPSPLLDGDLLYIVNDMASIATCLDAKTGEKVWQGRLGVAKREGFSASPVLVDGKLFFTNDDGETFVLKAGRTFELLHVNRMNERVLASPALADGRWYIRTSGHLYAIGSQ